MKAIKVAKSKLLETLKTNRDNHRAIFLEAQEGYRKTAIAEIEKMLDEARSGQKIRRMIYLTEPSDQTKDYDRVIKMLEMSEDEQIELSEEDFKCYVLDDWSWSGQFLAANSTYSATATGILNIREEN